MVQVYFLAELYLFLGAGLLLVDKYGAVLLFLINIKSFVYAHKQSKFILLGVGFLLVLGISLFPISPGPIILGDIIPALNIIGIMIFYLQREEKEVQTVTYASNGKSTLGWVTLTVAVLHFLFPSIVLI